MNAKWLLLLLAVAAVSAQEVTVQEIPSGYGSAAAAADEVMKVINQPVLATPQEPVHVVGGGDFAIVDSGSAIVDSGSAIVGGRKMLAMPTAKRTLQGVDGDGNNVTINYANNVLSKIGRHCPTTQLVNEANLYTNYDTYPNKTEAAIYGELVHDNFICDVAANGKGKVVVEGNATGVFYGGAAQDFGPSRPNWESYGWSLFRLSAPPADKFIEDVKIQGVTLHVVGNTGNKHLAGTQCGIKGVSIAIFNSEQDGDYNPNGLNYTKYIDLSGAGVDTFKWTTNRTAALYVDIAQAPDTYPRFTAETFHWLRVKLHADYTGWDGAEGGQCMIFWGVSSAFHYENTEQVKSRWQEKVGGSSGYSTTCVGADISGQTPVTVGTNAPGPHQTWWNCWNNGLNTAEGNTGRRCSTYRSTVKPAIPSDDCLAAARAKFHDYNYAFTGIQSPLSGVGQDDGQGGIGGSR